MGLEGAHVSYMSNFGEVSTFGIGGMTGRYTGSYLG